MANESRSRRGRAPATAQNSATLGVILVVFAVIIAILLFNAGGGNAADDGGDKTAAESANGSRESTTTTEATVETIPPGNLTVVVGNGSGISGRAKATADKLTPLGYTNIQAVDGKSTATTMVYYAEGFEADAKALAATMGLPDDRTQPLPAESVLQEPVEGAQLVVLVGPDFDPATAQIGVPTTAESGTN
jgi:hypothetical protein